MEAALADYLSHAPVFVRRTDGEIVYWTHGAEELFGFTADQAVGENAHELLKTEFSIPLEKINSDLEALNCWEGLLAHTRADGVKIWTESRWRIRGGPGKSRAVVETNTDVTQRENLARELDHRVKNTLAVVQGLARMSLHGLDPEKLKGFESRLRALATAHDILVHGHWAAASLKEVILKTTAPFNVDEQFVIEGEDTRLEPRSVVAYSLAFHELATNALKHGALSRPEGKVRISWGLQGRGDKIHLRWAEEGGPPPAHRSVEGAGTKLLHRVVGAELGTDIAFHFAEPGLICEFDGPIQKRPDLP